MVVNTFPKNVLVFVMVLNQLIIKVCYAFISRHFIEKHAVNIYNSVYQCEFQLEGRVIFSGRVGST